MGNHWGFKPWYIVRIKDSAGLEGLVKPRRLWSCPNGLKSPESVKPYQSTPISSHFLIDQPRMQSHIKGKVNCASFGPKQNLAKSAIEKLRC